MDRQGSVDNLLHASADGSGIVEGDGTPDVQVDIVTVTDGNVDSHLTRVIEVMGGLAEHEEEAAGVGTRATGRGYVEEFHFLLLVDTEVHALYLIINVGRDGTVFHVDARLLIYILEGATKRHFERLPVILTIHLNGLFHIILFVLGEFCGKDTK